MCDIQCPILGFRILFFWLSASGENQSCEEGEAFRDEPRLQDPLQGAQVRPCPRPEDQGAFSWTNGLNVLTLT